MPYQAVKIDSLEGLNEDENPSAVQPGQLRVATNCARRGNLTGTRPGLAYDSEYVGNLAGSPPVQGIHELRLNRDDDRDLLVVAGGDVYRDSTSGALTKSGASISSGVNNVWTFADYQGAVWAAGGDVSDSIWTWDGNPGNPVTGRLGSLSIDPRYAFAKFNCLFLGGMTGTDPWKNGLVGRYCNYAEDATLAASWPNSNTIPGQLLGENSGVGAYGSEYNTGFGSYQDNKGDFLLFLTNRRIISFRENPNVTSNANRFVETDAIANGCVDQRAFVDLGYDQGDAVFVSENGVHSMALSQQYGNRENAFLSWPIRKTWETLNRSRLKYTTASYWPDEGLVLIAVSTGSSAVHNLILCMDIKGARQITPDTVRWYKWPLNGINPNALVAARDPDGKPRVYVGGSSGQVAPFTRSAYSDLGASIPVKFRTKDEDYGFPASEKSVGDTFIGMVGQGAHMPQHTYVLDDATKTGKSTSLRLPSGGFVVGVSKVGDKFGSDESVLRDRVRGVGSGYTISHEFSHTGIAQPFFISQIVQDIAGQGMADEASA